MFNKYFPDFYYNRVELIPLSLFLDNNIKLVILDMDNTLVNYKYELNPKVIKWIKSLKKQDIKCHILSNSRRKRHVERIAKKVGIDYIYKAKKPKSDGFEKLTRKFNIPKENTVIIGDQIFTDIIGGKKFGIKTILVKPINFIEMSEGMLVRPIEFPIRVQYHYYQKKRLKNKST